MCGASVIDGRCRTAGSQEDAQAVCQGIGARLCDSVELERDVARGSGCELDDKMVWVKGLQERAPGSSRWKVSTKGTGGTASGPRGTGVRCCATSAAAPAAETPFEDQGMTELGRGNCRLTDGTSASKSAQVRVNTLGPVALLACYNACQHPLCGAFEYRENDRVWPCRIYSASAAVSHAGPPGRSTSVRCFVRNPTTTTTPGTDANTHTSGSGSGASQQTAGSRRGRRFAQGNNATVKDQAGFSTMLGVTGMVVGVALIVAGIRRRRNYVE